MQPELALAVNNSREACHTSEASKVGLRLEGEEQDSPPEGTPQRN